MQKLLDDIKILLSRKLSFSETIYFAAFIHFLFAKTHPFADGNGRSARLLEKWFISRHLGATAWALPTEVYYWQNRSEYYQKLNVGVNYYETLERLENVNFQYLLPQAICFVP
jgi:Fic family protein